MNEKNKQRRILVTGAAGFIGCHVVNRLLSEHKHHVVSFDLLTYAGNLENLKEFENHDRHLFVKGDICDGDFLDQVLSEHKITDVIHLAAESHVDRSITSPLDFVTTNVLGTVTLLNACKKHWQDSFMEHRFHHVSTDEVFGSLGETGAFSENTAYAPRSPYSASKASSDHFVSAYGHTYGMNVVISNCSNNYGPNQFPEKLIPLMINNIRKEKPLPVYGAGKNVRDWLWVKDHARAIDLVFHQGQTGETYNIGGNEEWTNIALVETLCDLMDELLEKEKGTSRKLITFVKDRPGHDLRYAIDPSKIRNDLNWEPSISFRDGLRETAQWYLEHQDWLDHVVNGEYRNYYEFHYNKE